MKRAASALAVLVLVVLGAVAAPALSLTRYRPRPLDFELRPPAGASARTAGDGPLTSRPLRAPKRFNLVGLQWRGRVQPRIAVRARRSGGRFTPWTPLDADSDHAPDPASGEPVPHGVSTPTWVGEADFVQYRLSRPVPGLRLHFVNVEGTATAADRARTAIRRFANAAVASLAGLGRTGAAGAQEQRPPIVPREAWAAGQCQPRTTPQYGVVKAAFIHHTVTANDYSAAQAPDIVLGICRYHRDVNGWNDIGYNFLVDKYGTIYEGRAGGVDEPVVGAQAQGYNAQTTGIANLGTYSSVAQSDAALSAMARLIRWKLPLHGVPTGGTTTLVSAGGESNRYPAGRTVSVPRILGHRDLGRTECPGGALYRQLPELRRLVGNVGPAGSSTTISARASARSVSYGTPVWLSGRVAAPGGAPLGGAPVEIQRFRRRWETAARALADDGGAFSVALTPRGNALLRARFPGDGSHAPSRSRPTLVLLRPLIALTSVPARVARGGRLPLRGSVSPAKRRVWLVLELRRSGRNRRLGASAIRARHGRFRASFRPASRGLYRIYVVARADRSTARGASPVYLVRVGRRARARG